MEKPTPIVDDLDINALKKDDKITIYANHEQIRTILKQLNYAIDTEGYVIQMDTNKRVLSSDNDEIKFKEIGVIKPANSPHIFIKNNLGSLSEYIAQRE